MNVSLFFNKHIIVFFKNKKLLIVILWPRGGMVTQRIANPCIPVRFWAWPPKKILSCNKKKVSLTNNTFLGSSVGRAVDC